MKKQIPEHQKILERFFAKKFKSYGKQITKFNRKLCDFVDVDVYSIECKQIFNLSEIKRFLIANNFENVNLMILDMRYGYNNIVITDYKNKVIKYSTGFYPKKKIVFNSLFEGNNEVYMLYPKQGVKKYISELKLERLQNKKNSYLDYESPLYRCKGYVHNWNIDKSGYADNLNNAYKIICERFLKNELSYFLDYMLNKELKAHVLFNNARKFVYNNGNTSAEINHYPFLNFSCELKCMRDEILKYQNKNSLLKNYLSDNPNADADDFINNLEQECIKNLVGYLRHANEQTEYFRKRINSDLNDIKSKA